jgi:hypothetical protein
MDVKKVILVLALFAIPGFSEKPDSAKASTVMAPYVAFQLDQTASLAGASAANQVKSKTASLRQLDTISRTPATNVVVQKNVFISGFDRFLDMWR